MLPDRRKTLAGLAALATSALAPRAALAGSDAQERAYRALVFTRSEAQWIAALEELRGVTDPGIVAPLILVLRYGQGPRLPVLDIMAAAAGEAHEGWFEWMLWQERHPEVVPHPGYTGFKRDIFLAIDPNFELFLDPAHLGRDAARIRFEEVTWGGVRKDGIPALTDPALIQAGEADYLLDDDPVFGVSVNGDARAYPLRIMGWHEMFNDTVGGVPLSLAYCTLCGAGILFEAQAEGRAEPFVFGSSGFLYRSNKLMYDSETHSLWNQFTGEPVIGELAGSGIALRQRPVVIAPWGDWRGANPETRVLALETGFARDYGSGVVYRDYFASPELMFPAAVDETRLRQKDQVFGIRTFGAAKAWPLSAFEGRRVINDRVGDLAVVLVGDAAGRTVRAYERGEREFLPADEGLSDQAGAWWAITEEALAGPDGARLPRVAGHLAYWFAWDGYMGIASGLWAE